MTPLSDDLLAPEVLANPYPLFRQLSERDPVHWSARWGGWILTRYADVSAALTDRRLSSDAFTPFRERLQAPERERWSMIFRLLAPSMVYRDPPEHTRLRTLVTKVFTRAVIERARPRIQPIADELIDRKIEQGRMDLIHDFAYPLPVTVIAEVVGADPEDGDRIKNWSDDIATLMLGAVDTPDRHDRANRALGEMADYFREIVRERRRAPRDDVASALVAVHDRDERLTEDELVGMCALMIFAAHETTTNVIANGMLALLDHPSERARLEAALDGDDGGATLTASAVEEMLRFDGPMKAISRVAAAPLDLGGRRVEAGQRVLCVLGAANRDPARFPDPDRFEVARRDNGHIAFGYGIHYCLGAPLARVEAQISVASLLRRLRGLRLAAPRDALDWHEALLVRGVRSMPVEFAPGHRV